MKKKPVIAALSVAVDEKSMTMPIVTCESIEKSFERLMTYGAELDLVLFPMYTIGKDDASIADKQDMLCTFAKEHDCYVVYSAYLNGYSVSIILDRQGREVGRCQKTHKIEGMDLNGLLLGDEFPVFELDFAKVALLAGTDVYIPEVAEMYSVAGAELLLCSMGVEPLRDDTILQRVLHARAVSNYVFVAAATYASDHPMYMCSNFEAAHRPTDAFYEGIGVAEDDFNSNGLGRLTGRAIVYDLRGEIIASSGREAGAAVAPIFIEQKKEAKKYVFGTAGIIFHQNQRGVFNDL